MDETDRMIDWWHVALPCLFFALLWVGTLAARRECRLLGRRINRLREDIDRGSDRSAA